MTGFNFGNLGNTWSNNGFIGYQPVVNAARDVANTVGNGNSSWWSNLLGKEGMGTLGGIFGGLSQLGGLASGIMQGLAGFQQLGLANKMYNLGKQQFTFQKNAFNRNLANQAHIINNTYDNAAQVAAGMIGKKDANGNYGFNDPAIVRQYAANARRQHVDGSAIG